MVCVDSVVAKRVVDSSFYCIFSGFFWGGRERKREDEGRGRYYVSEWQFRDLIRNFVQRSNALKPMFALKPSRSFLLNYYDLKFYFSKYHILKFIFVLPRHIFKYFFLKKTKVLRSD